MHWLTKWFSFGNKTITRAPSQTGLPSASVPVKVCQVFDASLPASPHLDRLPPSHGDVGQLSLLASRPAVWDVLPVLQSGGKWWQAYLPWRSLTWKKGGEKKGGWRSSQLHWAPSSTAETHSGKKRKCPFHEFVLLELSLYSKKCSVRRPAWDISRRLNITNYKYKKKNPILTLGKCSKTR